MSRASECVPSRRWELGAGWERLEARDGVVLRSLLARGALLRVLAQLGPIGRFFSCGAREKTP